MIGYYYVLHKGWEAYRIFVPVDQSAFIEPEVDKLKGSANTGNAKGNSYKALPNATNTGEENAENNGDNNHSNETNSPQQVNKIPPHLIAAQETTKMKLRAILWKRQSLEEGGLYVKYFAVLEKGRLDFYYKENVSSLKECIYSI